MYAALGSWLDARSAGGEWLVRIEDVDRAREQPGAADSVLRTLDSFGLHWDGAVLRQSTRGDAYAAALESLAARDLVDACSCTRGELPPSAPGEEPRYPGTCRNGPRRPSDPLALRFRATALPGPITVTDRLQGQQTQDVASAIGDFVLRRKDGFWAYQLAVVVDDAFQRVTDVVRGLDLWDNAPRQRRLQEALGLPAVRYLHLPLVTEAGGTKLSKSRRSLPADPAEAPRLLGALLGGLGIAVPPGLRGAPVGEQLAWAISEWRPDRLAGLRRVDPPSMGPGLPEPGRGV